MGSKFLNSLHGESLSALTNGTVSLYLKSLKINDLEDSKNVVVDDKFLTTGGASELIFINSDNHASPNVGISKIYFKTDGNLYKKNNLGEESTLAGGYSLITLTEEDLKDIDYKSDYDKITWTNTTQNTRNFYNYYTTPHKPKLRTPFVPLDNRATNIFSEADLDLAITDQKDNIFIAGDFSITASKVIAFSCKISGNPDSKPTITAVGLPTSLFNVSADNVFFENLILENANSNSGNCIYFGFNNEAINNAVHNCVFRTNKFAINADHPQIQIYNNVFEFTGTADSHSYINLPRCNGEVLIYENTFYSNGSGSPNTDCIHVDSSSGSTAYENGHLVIYKNISVGVIQRMAIMQTEPINFKLSLLENTIDTNTDFFIIYGATMLNGFSEITAYKNTVSLMPTSAGFNGLVGWDGPSGGGDITYCPVIRGSLNTLPSNLSIDYSPIPNTANILCYNNTVFTTSLTVPLNPSLVAFGEGITDDERNNISSNVAKLVNQTAVASPVPITTLVGELDVAKIKSYEHNCELQFDDTDAALIADGTVTISAPGVILGGTVTVSGTIYTNQASFTQDQQLITKKYVDDGNASQDIAISANTAKTQNMTAGGAGLTYITGTVVVNNLKLFPTSTLPSLTEGTFYIDDKQKQLNLYLNGQLNSIELNKNIDQGKDFHTLEEDAKIDFLETFLVGDKYGCSVLGPADNKIYGMPYNSGHILEFDYVLGTVTGTYAIPNQAPDNYQGAVLHPNGKIYCSPLNAAQVLEFDPITKAVNLMGSVLSGQWFGAVLHPNGLIYCPPWQSTNDILVIDPVSQTTSISVFPSVTFTGSIGYGGGCLSRNNKIYCTPFDGQNQILEIDPYTNTTVKFGSLTGGYSGAVLAENGLIYGVPYGATKVVEIDPYNRQTTDIGFTLNTPLGGNKWRGGVLAPNGRIYCAPFSYEEILEIDPVSRQTREIETNDTPGISFRHAGITLAPNGKLYALPRRNLQILVVTPSGGAKIPTGRHLSAYYNKF